MSISTTQEVTLKIGPQFSDREDTGILHIQGSEKDSLDTWKEAEQIVNFLSRYLPDVVFTQLPLASEWTIPTIFGENDVGILRIESREEESIDSERAARLIMTFLKGYLSDAVFAGISSVVKARFRSRV